MTSQGATYQLGGEHLEGRDRPQDTSGFSRGSVVLNDSIITIGGGLPLTPIIGRLEFCC